MPNTMRRTDVGMNDGEMSSHVAPTSVLLKMPLREAG